MRPGSPHTDERVYRPDPVLVQPGADSRGELLALMRDFLSAQQQQEKGICQELCELQAWLDAVEPGGAFMDRHCMQSSAGAGYTCGTRALERGVATVFLSRL